MTLSIGFQTTVCECLMPKYCLTSVISTAAISFCAMLYYQSDFFTNICIFSLDRTAGHLPTAVESREMCC